MNQERTDSAAAVRIAVRWIKGATVAVLSLRLLVVGLAAWGVATGRASVHDLFSSRSGMLRIMVVSYTVELILGGVLLTSSNPYSTRFRISLSILVAMLALGLAVSAVGWLIPSTGLPQPEVLGMTFSAVYVCLGLRTFSTLRKHATETANRS